MEKASINREVNELLNQLSYSKNMGFFFGAGTSTALGVPNIAQLTVEIEKRLENGYKKIFLKVKQEIEENPNIEDILNYIRLIREITGEKDTKNHIGINGLDAKNLDFQICRTIYKIITEKEVNADLNTPKKFFSWLDLLNREYTKEIFTSNYDLIFERSLESCNIPYFDGFVGAYEPFFHPESLEQIRKDNNTPPASWIRIWKIHGSLSWFWQMAPDNVPKIIRQGKIENIENINNELVVYPSKEKYTSSRKQPFIAYFDRMKSFLTSGELLFLVSGYSFSDEHINEILFNSLRQNNRLFIIVFFFSDSNIDKILDKATSHLNLSAFGPTKGIIGGTLFEWEYDKDEEIDSSAYWDESINSSKLGDFNNLVEFLIKKSGKKELINQNAN